MESINNINLISTLDSFVSLLTAFLLGSLIGYERQYRQRTAGLRTNVLVAVGAAAFVDIANRLYGHDGATHVIAYVVSGVGFLGAGVIMRENGNVRGLNTAATLWGSAAVGASAGADLIVEALLISLFVLFGNTLLRPVVNHINRQPLHVDSVEMTSVIYLIVEKNSQTQVITQFEQLLEQLSLPATNIRVHLFGDAEVEIEATIAIDSVSEAELDKLVNQISALNGVRQAFWTPSQRD